MKHQKFRYLVVYGTGRAKFSDALMAGVFARMMTVNGGIAEVMYKTGLIAQFEDGYLSAEFANCGI